MTPQETIAQLQQTNADLAAQNRRLLELLARQGMVVIPDDKRAVSGRQDEERFQLAKYLDWLRGKYPSLYPTALKNFEKTFKL